MAYRNKGFRGELDALGGDVVKGLRQGFCPTPGNKIRSGGQGRGLARGQGRGPIGRGFGARKGLGRRFSNNWGGDFSNL